MPDQSRRLYVFKGKEQLAMDEPLRIHRKSFYLIGRDEKACDIVVAHPSCSKQHAVIQFRQREVQRPDGSTSFVIRPCLLDLGSTNGTTLMAIKREPLQYFELFENDLIQFNSDSARHEGVCTPQSGQDQDSDSGIEAALSIRGGSPCELSPDRSR